MKDFDKNKLPMMAKYSDKKSLCIVCSIEDWYKLYKIIEPEMYDEEAIGYQPEDQNFHMYVPLFYNGYKVVTYTGKSRIDFDYEPRTWEEYDSTVKSFKNIITKYGK